MIEVPTGKFAGYAVVIDPGCDAVSPRPYVVTADRQARRLALIDFPVPVASVATGARCPKSFNGRNPQMRRDLASALRIAHPRPGAAAARQAAAGQGRSPTRVGRAARSQELRDRLRAHPCHACPDREDHDRWAAALVQARPRRRHAAPPGRDTAPTPSPASSTGSARC